MSDAVDIMNEFTNFNPLKGEEPLPLPIPGHWFRKICALADRIVAAEARAEAAEAENERLHARNKELEDNFSAFIGHLRCGHNEKAHLQMLVLEVLVDEGKKYGADK